MNKYLIPREDVAYYYRVKKTDRKAHKDYSYYAKMIEIMEWLAESNIQVRDFNRHCDQVMLTPAQGTYLELRWGSRPRTLMQRIS